MKCGICGKDFKQVKGNQLYCSPECRNTAHNRLIRERQRGMFKECKTCGKKFIPTQKFRNYCSDECRDAIILERREEYKVDLNPIATETRNKEKHLNISISNANKLGMSYGKYKAMLYLQNQKEGKQ